MPLPKTRLLAAAVVLCASAATTHAATLSSVSVTGPSIDGPFDMVNFFGFFGSGTVTGNTATTPVADSLATGISGSIASDNTFTSGSMTVTDGGAGWLSGTLIDLAVASDPAGDDTITMLFDDIAGTAGAEFGDFVVAELTGEFGATPFGFTAPMSTFGVSGSATFSGATSAVAPIPLPAGIVLLASALGLLALRPVPRRA